MSSETLVLAFHPLSANYRRVLEDSLGGGYQYSTIAELKKDGFAGLARKLMLSRVSRVVIPYEVPEGRSVLSILGLLAAAHKFPRIQSCDPRGVLSDVKIPAVVAGAVRLGLASLEGAWAWRQSGAGALRARTRVVRAREITAGPHRVLYLNSNLWFGLRTGGSVGHVTGVIGGLVNLGHEVALVGPMHPGEMGKGAHFRQVPIPRDYAVPGETNRFRIQSRAVASALELAREFRPTLVYQRLSLGDWSGVEIADALNLPLIVEYNGSEVWIARNWGGRIRFAKAMIAAEEAMMARADLVFTVSQALHQELLERGIDPSRAAWYPNCVDPELFDPSRISTAARSAVRANLGAGEASYVVMFIGTFGLWHGAEVFAKAAAVLAKDESWMRGHGVRFVFVGDGTTRRGCAETISSTKASEYTVFTGLVPQHEAPAYLAAADAFVSPHVPNADGSKFFGSPTKLFEYMAMGRPIVASALDQISDVLVDGHTAAMTRPADVDDLVRGIRRVVEDRVWGKRLGAAARAEVMDKYTWTHHAERILAAFNPGQKA